MFITPASDVYVATRIVDRAGVLRADWLESLDALLTAEGNFDRAMGGVCAMNVAYRIWDQRSTVLPEFSDELARLGIMLASVLESDTAVVYEAAAWALAWIGIMGAWRPSDKPTAIPRLFELWRAGPTKERQALLAWAFATQPLLDRDGGILGEPTCETDAFLAGQAEMQDSSRGSRLDRYPASLIGAYYFRSPWPDDEIARRTIEGAAELPGAPGSGIRTDAWLTRLALALGVSLPPPREDEDEDFEF